MVWGQPGSRWHMPPLGSPGQQHDPGIQIYGNTVGGQLTQLFKQFAQFIDAFIDDTSLISAQKCHQNFCKLLMTLQQNLDLWHGLLQASGSVLNLSSCVWLSSLGNLLLMAQCRLYHHLKSHHCTQQLTMHYLFPSSNFSHRQCTDIWAST